MVTAHFDPRDKNRVDLVIEPSTTEERLLLAAWLGYDGNVLSAAVERYDNGPIKTVTIQASDGR